MKKIIVTVLGFLLCASSAFAAGGDVTATTGQLSIGGTANTAGDATKALTIGLSPKVIARYVTDGDSETTAQWYAISTVHPGGNVGYGTAQDVNNIYMINFVTGDDTTTVTAEIPETKVPALTEAEIAADPEAKAATWVNNGWTLTAPVAE